MASFAAFVPSSLLSLFPETEGRDEGGFFEIVSDKCSDTRRVQNTSHVTDRETEKHRAEPERAEINKDLRCVVA